MLTHVSHACYKSRQLPILRVYLTHLTRNTNTSLNPSHSVLQWTETNFRECWTDLPATTHHICSGKDLQRDGVICFDHRALNSNSIFRYRDYLLLQVETTYRWVSKSALRWHFRLVFWSCPARTSTRALVLLTIFMVFLSTARQIPG
jgi:hypothetical protein